KAIGQHAEVGGASGVRIVAEYHVARFALEAGTERDDTGNGRAGKLSAEHDGHIRFGRERVLERAQLFACDSGDLPFTRGQPADRGRFLAGRNLDETCRFALQLDVARIDDEKFQTVVANTGADLPCDEWILVRGIVADEENGFRFVELIHRKERVFAIFAECCKKAGVVGGAMVVNVVRAEGDAREALEEIIFFVRSAVRTDKADGVGAVRVTNGFELRSGGLRCFFPGNRQELIALAYQRLLDTLRMFREIETEAAFHAKKIAIDAGEVAIVGAKYFVVADAQGG